MENDILQQKLLQLVQQVAVNEGLNSTAIPNVFCYKICCPQITMPAVYEPCLCIIVQGRKNVLLGTEMLSYGELEFLIASVDLPILGTVVEASEQRPYFVIQINIDVRLLSELLLQMQHLAVANKTAKSGLFIGQVDRQMGNSLLRLFTLLEEPDDIPVLSEALIREMHYRMLRSNYGKEIAQISLKGTPTQRISVAIQKLRRDYDQTVTIEELASLAGMSVSSFHVHFKSVTSMSPLQFQKSVRLVEARSLMISQQMDAATTAYKVGYESPSQFSREYARMFGRPPARDIARIRL
ncbi:AraC-like DNA-binding protein [Rheinheimera pacifica]|uniref:AraC family transcriptional regulator n=1 Tax=Rheinheimera pacifica TaxID=173990 RepID=UPI00285EB459|nr:AraC family transcriptional regulator [Rheinheimera pacifica]MDR6985087.1 AraC-like DNA-binding protein [Rheinheimera pacifica]